MKAAIARVEGGGAVTEGLLRTLGPRELRGVIAHEVAHIRNRDILVATVAAAIAAAVSYLANAVQWAAIFGGSSQSDDEGSSPVATLALAFVAPIAALMVQMGISRSREYLADEIAARLNGDPEGLASALERLSMAAQIGPATPQPATGSLFVVNPLDRRECVVQPVLDASADGASHRPAARTCGGGSMAAERREQKRHA